MSSRQFVIFKVNGEEFGIEISYVNIIEKQMDIFKIPNTPDYIEGLINLRGKVHTVINLRKRFNLPAAAFDENTKIIIVNINSVTVGLIVDEVNEIARIDDEEIENTPTVLTNLKRKYVSGIAKSDSRIIMLLDLNVVVSMSEEDAAPNVVGSKAM